MPVDATFDVAKEPIIRRVRELDLVEVVIFVNQLACGETNVLVDAAVPKDAEDIAVFVVPEIVEEPDRATQLHDVAARVLKKIRLLAIVVAAQNLRWLRSKAKRPWDVRGRFSSEDSFDDFALVHRTL